MTLQEERRNWEKQALEREVSSEVELEAESISSVSCLWVRVNGGSGKGVVLYLHGGGLTSGSILTHRNFVAELAEFTGMTFLIVDYRLLPENPFPAPLDDALSVYRALIGDKEIPARDIIIGGDSSGAGLALSSLVQLRDAGEELPSGAFMISGVFDMTLSGESMRSNNGKEPFLTLESLEEWQQTYFEDPQSPHLSPLFADLSGLPPILLLAGGHELWLSDSLRVAEKIEAGGGKVKLRVWKSMTHVWIMNPDLKESKDAMKEICEYVSDCTNTNREEGC